MTRDVHRRYIINKDYDANLFDFGSFLKNEGLRGLWNVWPVPWGAKGLEAWAWFTVFGVGQAAMQLLVPGKTFHGPISPKGNIPIYTVRSF
jgi:7-dehydrocholesterol reductase